MGEALPERGVTDEAAQPAWPTTPVATGVIRPLPPTGTSTTCGNVLDRHPRAEPNDHLLRRHRAALVADRDRVDRCVTPVVLIEDRRFDRRGALIAPLGQRHQGDSERPPLVGERVAAVIVLLHDPGGEEELEA